MNKLIKLASLGFAALAVSMSSCSDDDNNGPTIPTDKVNPDKVFTQGVPAEVGNMAISKNSKGLVTKIVEYEYGEAYKTTTFDYTPSSSRAVSVPASYDMTMNVEWGNDPDGVDFYIRLNAQGYIEYAYEVDEDKEYGDTAEEWWFKYNANGQLIEMKRTEGDNEVTTITYDANGDITAIALKDDDGPQMTSAISYTDKGHTTPILNKGGIMLYDDSFRIDMDEMAPAYYAGLLGIATKHLPLSAEETENDGYKYNYTYTWELNSNGLPEKFTATEGNYTDEPIIFKW